MPRPRSTPTQRNEQRQRIRKAAAEIYEEDGPDALSVRAIAARAGTSQGTIYTYFTNLADLMRSLWAEPVAKVGRDLERLAASIDDPVDRVRALLTAYLDFAMANPEVYRGAILYVRPTSAPSPDQQDLDKLPFYRLLAAALADAEQNGQLRNDDPRRIAELLWAGVHGAIALPINVDLYALTESGVLAAEMIDLLMAAACTPE